MQRTRTIGAAVAAVGIAAAALATTTTPAQARIAPGRYTFTSFYDNGSIITQYPVYVRGNRIARMRDWTWYDITPTKRGGSYAPEDGTRFNFWRKGNGYVGVAYDQWIPRHPSVTARASLTPAGTPAPTAPPLRLDN
ncbi:hypothetical protein [Gordonia sp. (in: high G+C Gram-positive bacteria)]|uniref:hypothetical protein n=1 Tax=Gordonia sp. (in: high G+C Gram-positive bacteria) TaxID=84139 RepID=UPI0039E3F2F8